MLTAIFHSFIVMHLPMMHTHCFIIICYVFIIIIIIIIIILLNCYFINFLLLYSSFILFYFNAFIHMKKSYISDLPMPEVETQVTETVMSFIYLPFLNGREKKMDTINKSS